MSKTNKSIAGLLDLSVAITGTEIDLDNVELLDDCDFGRISNWLMRGLGAALQSHTLDMTSYTTRGWVQEDKSLIVRLQHRNIVGNEFRVQQGRWRVITKSEMAEATRLAESAAGKSMAQELAQVSKALHERVQLSPDADQLYKELDKVILVLGKEPAGVHFLHNMAKDNPSLKYIGDGWMGSSAKFIVIPLVRTGSGNGEIEMAGNESQLLNNLAFQAECCKNIDRCALKFIGVATDVQDVANERWAKRGGNLILSRKASNQG
jgi:hypothetical protein